MVHYDGVEKSTNPGYPGPTTDGEEAPADVHHAATVSGPCISCLIAKRVAFFLLRENGESNSRPAGCTATALPLCYAHVLIKDK